MFDIDGFSQSQNDYLDYELSNEGERKESYSITCPFCQQKYVNVLRGMARVDYVCKNEDCKKSFFVDWAELK